MSVGDSTRKYAGLYAKALAGAAVAGLSAYSVAVQDGSGITASEALVIVGTVLVALGGIFLIPNVPEGVRVYGKAILGAVIALVGTLGTGLTDGGLSQVEVVGAIIAFIVALGLVGVTSNAASSDPVTPKGKVVPIPSEVKYNLYREQKAASGVITEAESQVVVGTE